MIENENNENLMFQISQLQHEGKSCGGIKKQIEAQIWDKVEKKLSPIRPRWQVIDSDDGVLFARKDYSEDRVKHMDIMEGNDEDKKHYKSIIIYETGNEENPVLIRTNNARKKRI